MGAKAKGSRSKASTSRSQGSRSAMRDFRPETGDRGMSRGMSMGDRDRDRGMMDRGDRRGSSRSFPDTPGRTHVDPESMPGGRPPGSEPTERRRDAQEDEDEM